MDQESTLYANPRYDGQAMSLETVRLKQELFREALTRGWTTPGMVEVPWRDLIPPERLARWYSRLMTPPDKPMVPEARFLNHFMLGADPEFMFLGAGGGRVDARALGLKAGLAFG